MGYNRGMKEINNTTTARSTKSAKNKSPRTGLHSALAVIMLAVVLLAVAVLFSKFGIAGKGGAAALEPSAAPAETPSPAPSETPLPEATPDASAKTPEPSAAPSPSVEPAEYVKTSLIIDGSTFASLASRQAAEELINTAVSHFELLCPGTGLVTEVENRIEYKNASESDEIKSFDEVFSELIGEQSPLRVKTVFTRSDIETLACSANELPSDRFYLGTRFVSSYGRDGKKLMLHEYTYMNGVLSAFTLLEESVLTEPVDEVVLIGSRPIPDGGEPARDFGFSECEPTELDFEPPVSGSITTLYGFSGGDFNRSIGFDCAAGSICTAPCGGTVSAVLLRGNMGLTVEISHGGGFVSRFINLQSADVSVGDALIKGDVIGRAGEGGLNYEIMVNGMPRNPLYYLNLGE